MITTKPNPSRDTGENNTASNAGSGLSLFYQKSGVDLQFNGIKSENNIISLSLDGVTHDIELTAEVGNIDHNSLDNTHNLTTDIDHTAISNIGSNSHVQIDSHIADSTLHFTEASLNLDDFLLLDGSRKMAGDLDMDGFDILTVGSIVTVSPELLADPGFDDAGEWTVDSFWSITGSQATHFGPPSSFTESNPFTVVADKVYKVTITIDGAYLINVSIGSTSVSFPSSAGTHTMYIKAEDTSSMAISGVGTCSIDSISVKVVSDGEFGNLIVGGDLEVSQALTNTITITGLNGTSNIGGTGDDAQPVLTVVGGDGGLGNNTGDGSDISFTSGSSPATLDTRGLGGNFEVLTGDGRYAGSIDLDTGISELSDKGPRGSMLLCKSGGRIALGGNFTPTAKLHIEAASYQTPGNAPLKLTDNGVGLLSSIEEGAFEFDSNVLWFSRSGTNRNKFVFGSGSAYRIPLWNSSNDALVTDTGFQYIYASQRLRVASGYEVFDKKVIGTQEPHIVDADGTLADITTKFNTLLAQLENHGLNASS